MLPIWNYSLLLVFKIIHKHKLFQLQVNTECKSKHRNNKINIRKFSRCLGEKYINKHQVNYFWCFQQYIMMYIYLAIILREKSEEYGKFIWSCFHVGKAMYRLKQVSPREAVKSSFLEIQKIPLHKSLGNLSQHWNYFWFEWDLYLITNYLRTKLFYSSKHVEILTDQNSKWKKPYSQINSVNLNFSLTS